MRFSIVATGAVLALLLWAVPASSNTFSFGSPGGAAVGNGGGSQSNCPSSDAGFSSTQSGGGSSVNFRGQASADVAAFSGAGCDRVFTWTVPYTITRTVGLQPKQPPPPPAMDAMAIVPIQRVSFDISFSGGAGISEFGGFEGAQVFSATVSSLGGHFGAAVLGGAARDNSDGTTTFNNNASRSWDTTTNESGPDVAEISFAFEIPTDYRLWDDFVAPFALDYSDGSQTFVQSFSDTLQVSFRVRAWSRTSGSISTTAGEALACAGLQSNLGAFSFSGNCGSGLTIDGGISQIGTQLVAVPEPTTLVLLGTAIAGLGVFGSRLRRRD